METISVNSNALSELTTKDRGLYTNVKSNIMDSEDTTRRSRIKSNRNSGIFDAAIFSVDYPRNVDLTDYTARHEFDYPREWETFINSEKVILILNDIWFNLRGLEYIPTKDRIFAFLKDTTLDDVSVVIVGQDPYDKPQEATGMAFSTSKYLEYKTPSIEAIYTELEREHYIALDKEIQEMYPIHPDMDERARTKTLKARQSLSNKYRYIAPKTGSLRRWRSQGVLLLNSALTIVPHSNKQRDAKKHYELWRAFVVTFLSYINSQRNNVVFMFWGVVAKSLHKEQAIKKKAANLYLEGPHPVNRQGKFVGCGHFSQANEFLVKCGKKPIEWNNLQ